MKNKKRIISLALASMISMGLLTGCGEKDTQAEEVESSQSIVTSETNIAENDINKLDSYDVEPEIKTFESGEHVFMIRYNYMDELGYDNAKAVDSASISVPEGYKVLDVENYISLGGKIGTSQTYGVDVWFINNESVEVEPVFNEAFNSYDYSRPGKVITKEEEFKLTK